MNLSWSSKFLEQKMKLPRLVLAQAFDEIEVAVEEEALRIGRVGAEIRNQYA
jgi:hypothetical protein